MYKSHLLQAIRVHCVASVLHNLGLRVLPLGRVTGPLWVRVEADTAPVLIALLQKSHPTLSFPAMRPSSWLSEPPGPERASRTQPGL